MKKLYRSDENKTVAGIIGGVGEYFNIDPVVLRLLLILILIFTGFVPGLITYFIAMLVVPKKPHSA